MKQKKLALRKCTGCQEMKDKRQLIRVVRNQEGEITLDYTGKKPGRGAYICPNEICLGKAQKTKGLERSFKCEIPAQVYELLRNELMNQNE